MDQIAIPCSCGCSVVVVMEIEEWQHEPQEFFVDFYTHVGNKASLRFRIKTAWRIIRKKNHYIDALAFDTPSIKRLKDWLDTKIK